MKRNRVDVPLDDDWAAHEVELTKHLGLFNHKAPENSLKSKLAAQASLKLVVHHARAAYLAYSKDVERATASFNRPATAVKE